MKSNYKGFTIEVLRVKGPAGYDWDTDEYWDAYEDIVWNTTRNSDGRSAIHGRGNINGHGEDVRFVMKRIKQDIDEGLIR